MVERTARETRSPGGSSFSSPEVDLNRVALVEPTR